MNDVTRSVLLILITEVLMNPVPFTVKVNAGPPGTADCGFRLTICGVGFVMYSTAAAEVPPPGGPLTTAIVVDPTLAISDAGMEAISCVDETYVVGRFSPCASTTELGRKLLPLTVKLKP